MTKSQLLYKFQTFILLCSFQILIAQIPDGYYDTAINQGGADLKLKLNQIIDNHVEFPYTASETDVWDILKETDKDPNNPDNVILIYSGVSMDGDDRFNPFNTNGWIREHVWAKSRGDFGTEIGPGTDVHALRPLDIVTNVSRNNRAFNNCTNCEIVEDQSGNDTGSKRDTNEYSFEPRDAVKGDVARMLFYMAVRYEGLDGYVDLELTETVLPLGDNTPFLGVQSTLLQWHRDDPVDDFERNRNDVIYYSFQQNRNPFIDHPELAEYLWGNNVGEVWGNTLSTSEFETNTIHLFPNPTQDVLTIRGLTTNTTISIYDTLGKNVMSFSAKNDQNTINLSTLKGLYILKLTTNDYTITKKIVVQ
ncbi:endonuclease [Aquimarina litoralis]|uniref:endonuclease n=1 Tax=Aquimarina litoralis TaxID=584605 RepID=UPI001C55BD47|nr:endonuclease [Aquimarina litoralis]MBW1295606.1 T9SS type A sorting domain-containing protein [Aquimarina litoralis]